MSASKKLARDERTAEIRRRYKYYPTIDSRDAECVDAVLNYLRAIGWTAHGGHIDRIQRAPNHPGVYEVILRFNGDEPPDEQ